MKSTISRACGNASRAAFAYAADMSIAT